MLEIKQKDSKWMHTKFEGKQTILILTQIEEGQWKWLF